MESAQGKIEYPLFLIYEDGQGKFLSKRKAGVLMDSMWSKVECGRLVLNEDFTIREITDKECNELVEIADNYSNSK